MEICSSAFCTGCGMCTNICPYEAIKMVNGLHGFVFPEIDSNKCVECGLCAAKCPAINEKKSGNTMNKIYAAWNRQKNVRKSSTSGGVFSLVVDYILKENGLVAGVQWNKEFCPEHRITDDCEIVQAFRGSKYVQSDTGKIYLNVKKALDQKRKVLFSGTPCQVAGLKSFLQGEVYDKLILVDVVCQGVPSPVIFKKFIDEVEQKYKIKVVDVVFRSKKYGWRCGLFLLLHTFDGREIEVMYDKNSYYR